MVYALTWQRLVTALVLAVLASVCLFVFLNSGATSVEIWAGRGIFSAVILSFLSALAIPRIFSQVLDVSTA